MHLLVLTVIVTRAVMQLCTVVWPRDRAEDTCKASDILFRTWQ